MTPDLAELKRIAEAQDDGLAKRLEEEASVLRNADQVLFQSTIPTRDGPSRLLSNALIMSEAASRLRSQAARIEALEAGLSDAKFGLETTDACLRSWNGGLGAPANVEAILQHAANLLGDRHD